MAQKIFILDDEPADRAATITGLLNKLGDLEIIWPSAYSTESFRKGELAIAVSLADVEKLKPNLVILDLCFNDKTYPKRGISLLAQMRLSSIRQVASIPVLIVSDRLDDPKIRERLKTLNVPEADMFDWNHLHSKTEVQQLFMQRVKIALEQSIRSN